MSQEEYQKWSDYNATLLATFFQNSRDLFPSRRARARRMITPMTSLPEQITDLLEEIRDGLAELGSVHERLDLYAEAKPHNSPSSRGGNDGPPGSNVFVVHGHDEGARQWVARMLERLRLVPIILHEQPNAGRTLIEKVEANANVGFAVVLLTGDDSGYSVDAPGQQRRRARQNVILELGFFLGKLGRERICVLYGQDVELPSDIEGLVYVKLDADGHWRYTLGKELQHAGYSVDLNEL